MKYWNWANEILFFLFCIFLLSPKVYALAGFGEFHSTLHYNEYADMSWGHPSDGCRYRDQHCFHLIEKKQLKNPFNEALHQISLPQVSNHVMVLIESSDGRWIGEEIYGTWVIYDLLSEGVIFSTDYFEEALKKWKKLGLQEPKFASAYNLSDYFPETKESKAENNRDFFSIYLPIFLIGFFLVPILVHWDFFLAVILLVFFVYLYKRLSYKRY